MKIIKIMKLRITDLYQLAQTNTKQEWKELANAFFRHKILGLELTEEEIKVQKTAKEKAVWNKLLEVLIEGVPMDKIAMYSMILKNQHRYLNEYSTFGKEQPAVSILPIVRRVLPDLTIKDLIGVQPMQGPVGLVYKLRYTEQEENDQEGKRLTIEIVSDTVEAQSRMLKTAWSLEAEEDLALHGINIENEMRVAIAQEVAHEFNSEWLKRISKIANQSSYNINDNADLIIAINKAALRISINTRRGAGNWIVVSPTTLARIQEVANRNMSPRDMFVAPEKFNPNDTNGLRYVGILNNAQKVYVDMYKSDDEILVGYKGVNGETDTGLIFSPYVTLMPSGVVVDPETFAPRMTLMTRYGTTYDDDSHNYYEKMKITYKDKT